MTPRVSERERAAILSSLAAGVVPGIGLHHIQVGRKAELEALLNDLRQVEEAGAALRFIVGRYGAGKSFFLNLVRQSILRDAFAGKLVPQDPTDQPAAALLERIRAGQKPAAPTRRSPTRRRRSGSASRPANSAPAGSAISGSAATVNRRGREKSGSNTKKRSARGCSAAPQTGNAPPQSSRAAPQARSASPQAWNAAPQASSAAPHGRGTAPRGRSGAPRGRKNSLRAGAAQPKSGAKAQNTDTGVQRRPSMQHRTACL